MSRRTTIAVALVALVAAAASACTGPTDPAGPSASASPIAVKVAFFEDLTVPGAAQVVTPSFLALRLALANAVGEAGVEVSAEVIALDTEGDASRAVELAHDVANDPSYVAAVVGPFWSEPVDVGDILDAARIPTLSLSGLDASLAQRGWSSWRRLVPGTGRQTLSLATELQGVAGSNPAICLAGDGSPYAATVTGLLTEDLAPPRADARTTVSEGSPAADAVAHMTDVGCRAVGWTGFAEGAVLLRAAMSAGGLSDVPILGMDAMKTDGYLTITAGDGEGTIVTCGCVDLATSNAPEAGRFIHDFQSEYGSPPGVYAAEAWDAGRMLIAALASGATDRLGSARGVAMLRSFRGLATTYRFAPDGELEPTSATIDVFRGEGVRWVPIGEATPQAVLPVVTPGYLSMSACRVGRPFVYEDHGRLRGFDVELAGMIARRLGLTLSWDDQPCRAAIEALTGGTTDAVIASAGDVAQGTPASGIALSLHAALVTTRETATGARPFLERLTPGDVVAVVGGGEPRSWAKGAISPTGATLRMVEDATIAYRGLTDGSFAAVVDLEPDAWAAVERRPDLAVAQSVDIGAHDVIVAKGPDAILVAAIDQVLGRLIRTGRYTLLFAKYFPGTPVPEETGS